MNHHERQFMQHLRGGGWVKAHSAPPAGPKLIDNLLIKGWVERRGTENQVSYRITEAGLAAKKAKIPIRVRAEAEGEVMTDQAEEQKLPQARMYWNSAKWGFESLLQEKLVGYGYKFYVIGILASLRAVQHSLHSHDRTLSPQHEEIISEWWKKTADDKDIPDLRFIKNSRNLILKAGSYGSYAIHTESGIGEGANYQVTRTEPELSYPDEHGHRQDLEAAIRSAISWCDRELSEIERQLG